MTNPLSARAGDIDDCAFVTGLLYTDDEKRFPPLPFVIIAPTNLTAGHNALAARFVFREVIALGLRQPADSPYEIIATHAPGWRATLGPTRANIYVPGGVSLASPIDTRRPGWADAIRNWQDRLVVYYCLSDTIIGTDDIAATEMLFELTKSGGVAGGLIDCTWHATDPPA